MIDVKNIEKSFRDIKALKDLSFTVEKGITGLIGPNGAGKSTTIKIILGLIHPDKGEVKLFGKKFSSKSLKDIGVLHEKCTFPTNKKGIEYLKYMASLKNVSEKEIHETAELCGICHALERKIRGYSAGMIQRLGLVDALLGYPKLVILDEPTSNLDPLARIEFLKLIQQFYQDYNVSFLISTHILPELEKVCDSVIILNEGELLECGKIKNLIKKYFREEYIVYPIINIKGGKIKERNGVMIVEVENKKEFLDSVNRNYVELLYKKDPNLEDIFIEVLKCSEK